MATFMSAYGSTKKVTKAMQEIDSGINCPKCASNDIRYSKEFTHSHYDPQAAKYLCLKCSHSFDATGVDANATGKSDSDSGDASTTTDIFELPIDTWIHCWYLSGCIGSITYIAAKLDLDLEAVELMLAELQKI
ncbi:MAG: hypothetical protein COB50_03095, partial [Thiotrichales bacterium]